MKDIFGEYGIFSDGLLHLSPCESRTLCGKGAVIVDVREEYLNVYKRFDAPSVIYMPLSEIKTTFAELPDDLPLIMADAAGLRSKEAAQFLISKGYGNVANMAGGMVEWERDGLPLTIDKAEKLTGSCMCQLRPREQKKAE